MLTARLAIPRDHAVIPRLNAELHLAGFPPGRSRGWWIHWEAARHDHRVIQDGGISGDEHRTAPRRHHGHLAWDHAARRTQRHGADHRARAAAGPTTAFP